MAQRRFYDKSLPNAMITKLTDAYMRHQWPGGLTSIQMMVYLIFGAKLLPDSIIA